MAEEKFSLKPASQKMTTSAILNLRQASSEEQAKLRAELIDDQLAKKSDLEKIRWELGAEIAKAKSDIRGWLVTQSLAAIGLRFTLIKFFG